MNTVSSTRMRDPAAAAQNQGGPPLDWHQGLLTALLCVICKTHPSVV